MHNICIEWAIKSIPVEPVWTRGTETFSSTLTFSSRTGLDQVTQNKSLVTLRRAQAAAGLPRCREAFYASFISDFIIFASSCSLHLSTLELYVSDLLQPIRLVQFIMAPTMHVTVSYMITGQICPIPIISQ